MSQSAIDIDKMNVWFDVILYVNMNKKKMYAFRICYTHTLWYDLVVIQNGFDLFV